MAKKNVALTKVRQGKTNEVASQLFGEIRGLIEIAREHVAQFVNATLVELYWRIGSLIRKQVLGEERGEYGKQIVHALCAQLVEEYGPGYSEKSVRHMIRFSEVFPSTQIVSALRRQLSWTHLRSIIYLDDPLKREFYVEMCPINKWSTRELDRNIQGMLYERTAISKKPDKLIKQELKSLHDEDKLTPDLVFRDPYFLDFLGLRDTYSRRLSMALSIVRRWVQPDDCSKVQEAT